MRIGESRSTEVDYNKTKKIGMFYFRTYFLAFGQVSNNSFGRFEVTVSVRNLNNVNFGNWREFQNVICKLSFNI